jgi:hypothetical protein
MQEGDTLIDAFYFYDVSVFRFVRTKCCTTFYHLSRLQNPEMYISVKDKNSCEIKLELSPPKSAMSELLANLFI